MADLCTSVNPPTTDAPRPRPWILIPAIMEPNKNKKKFLQNNFPVHPNLKHMLQITPFKKHCFT